MVNDGNLFLSLSCEIIQ